MADYDPLYFIENGDLQFDNEDSQQFYPVYDPVLTATSTLQSYASANIEFELQPSVMALTIQNASTVTCEFIAPGIITAEPENASAVYAKYIPSAIFSGTLSNATSTTWKSVPASIFTAEISNASVVTAEYVPSAINTLSPEYVGPWTYTYSPEAIFTLNLSFNGPAITEFVGASIFTPEIEYTHSAVAEYIASSIFSAAPEHISSVIVEGISNSVFVLRPSYNGTWEYHDVDYSGPYVVTAVMTDGKISLFTNFDFNSFGEYNGSLYGANESGIFLLEGTDDDGDSINTGIRIHENDFGETARKRIRSVSMGYTGTVKVISEENEIVYNTNNNGQAFCSRLGRREGHELGLELRGWEKLRTIGINLKKLSK